MWHNGFHGCGFNGGFNGCGCCGNGFDCFHKKQIIDGDLDIRLGLRELELATRHIKSGLFEMEHGIFDNGCCCNFHNHCF